ncbi:Osmotically-inducible protein Y [Burkholderiales bacterium]|nr:Osmotically-inducible protein Y [Burkholderiales bacterium]
MNARPRMTLLAAALAGAAILAGCGEPNPERVGSLPERTTGPAASATERIEQGVDRTTSMAAAAVDMGAAAIDDAAITGKVKAAIIVEPGLKALAIDVDTKDGVVTLTGTVDSVLDKERAVHVAQNVSGVVTVVDRLSLKSTG